MPDNDLHQVLMENKRIIESESELYLAGCKSLVCRGPKEYYPEVPEHLKGALLRGMRTNNSASYREGKEDAKRKHKMAVKMGYLDPSVKVEYLDNGQYRIK